MEFSQIRVGDLICDHDQWRNRHRVVTRVTTGQFYYTYNANPGHSIRSQEWSSLVAAGWYVKRRCPEHVVLPLGV